MRQEQREDGDRFPKRSEASQRGDDASEERAPIRTFPEISRTTPPRRARGTHPQRRTSTSTTSRTGIQAPAAGTRTRRRRAWASTGSWRRVTTATKGTGIAKGASSGAGGARGSRRERAGATSRGIGRASGRGGTITTPRGTRRIAPDEKTVPPSRLVRRYRRV